jgi:DNA-binding NarL/FixJ family response regulator
VTVRVLIADDQALVRGGFRKLLEAETDIDVVAEAADGVEALEKARLHRPDIVLMDIRMPRLDGLQATAAMLALPTPLPRVVVLTTYDLDEYIFDALKAGASGFLLKDSPPEDLISAIRVVASGEALLAPAVTRRLIEAFVSAPRVSADAKSQLIDLTLREKEVLQLLARGLSNGEIAAELHLGQATVKSHVSNLLMKLDLRDRVQAVVLAYESGLVKPGGMPDRMPGSAPAVGRDGRRRGQD